ncbi:hypothetical protein E5S67_03338 [Microcoleus sp. IPMA8]|uniref:Uncharacterized protein n=1 Tax=Microcoleus asticus IPMA8 TaxID=2563858 RepID=A0ABX2CZI3_9CYAN|nr:hypothetical protein [Microcoleus asticus IPMA8]
MSHGITILKFVARTFVLSLISRQFGSTSGS